MCNIPGRWSKNYVNDRLGMPNQIVFWQTVDFSWLNPYDIEIGLSTGGVGARLDTEQSSSGGL